MSAIEVVKRYSDAWNRHDADAIVALFVEGGTYSNPIAGQGLTGEAIASFAKGVFTAYPDASFEIVSIGDTGGGLVAWQWLAHGTNSGPLADGSPPTGRSVTLPGASFTQVESNKIRSEQAYHDRQTIDEQLNLYQMQADVAENRLIGTWKLRSLVYEAAATGQRSRPFGDHPGGYLSYSPDGRMYAIGVAEDRPKPLDLVATDEEKARLQGSMFAYAGTYMADGEKVIHHIDISWNQSWTGTDLVRFYKLDSSTLTITTAPARSAFDGEEGVFILVWEKVQ
jgi:steroid delta-isomerase-like uncharacterized protein